MPIRPGSTVENSLSHSRVTVLELPANGWLLEHRLPAGKLISFETQAPPEHEWLEKLAARQTGTPMPHESRPDIPEHFHVTWTETFEILAGEAYYKLNGEQRTARAGDTIVMPPGQPHIHPWNAGSTELVYRQRDDFGRADPQAAQDVLGVFATTAGLVRDGQGDATGQPRNPFQLAVTLKMLSKYQGYDTRLPIPAQKFIAATLGTLGEMLGYRAVMAKYVEGGMGDRHAAEKRGSR